MALSKHKNFNNEIKVTLPQLLLSLLLFVLILISDERQFGADTTLLRTYDNLGHSRQWRKIETKSALNYIDNNDNNDGSGNNDGKTENDKVADAINVSSSDNDNDCKSEKGDTKQNQQDVQDNGRHNNSDTICLTGRNAGKSISMNDGEYKKVDDVDVFDVLLYDNDADDVHNNRNYDIGVPIGLQKASLLTDMKPSKTAIFKEAAIHFINDIKQSLNDNANDDDEVVASGNTKDWNTKGEIMAALKVKLIYEIAIKEKKIPRVIYFTCSENYYHENNSANRSVVNTDKNNIKETRTSRKFFSMEILNRIYSSSSFILAKPNNDANKKNNIKEAYIYSDSNDNSIPISLKDIFIKIVQLDQLIDKPLIKVNNKTKRYSNADNKIHKNNKEYITQKYSEFSNLNLIWLETVLHPERSRQLVVLDLVCGPISRKIIEMASSKGLFNAAFHWLLIDEDYAVNRQTPINDNKNNNNKNNKNRNDSKNIRKRKQIVEYSNKSNNNYSNQDNNNADIDNAEVNKKIKKLLDYKTVANRYFSAKLLQSNGSSPYRHTQQQQGHDDRSRSFSGDAEEKTEDGGWIMEKFLEKINININTELILAKLTLQGGNMSATDPSSAEKISGKRKDYVYTLYDVWNPGHQFGGHLNITKIGKFSLDDDDNGRDDRRLQLSKLYRTSTTIARRMDMMGARIRCLIVVTHKNRTDTLEHYLTTRYDTHLDSMHRFNFALLAHVRDLFNFSLKLSETSSWGYLRNGTFDGMIGALTRNEADIGGSPIFFRLERAKVIDYTARTWIARPCFIFRHPRNIRSQRIVFLEPFSNDIWLLILICGFSSVFLLWAVASYEGKILPTEDIVSPAALRDRGEKTALATTESIQPTFLSNINTSNRSIIGGNIISDGIPSDISERTERQNNNNNNNNNSAIINSATAEKETAARFYALRDFRNHFAYKYTRLCGHDGDVRKRNRVGLFFESVLLYIGLICQQGVAYSTKLLSGRFIITISLFFSFAIYQFYSASIVGTLLMEKPKTIRTLRNLIQSSLEIGIEDILYNRDFFRRTNDPDALELYNTKLTQDAQDTEHEGLESSSITLHTNFPRPISDQDSGSNWYDPEYGIKRMKKGGFAFHVDVATAYKIISDTFTEQEICDLIEIQLFPPQKMVSIVQKGSPLRKVMTYGLRRLTEAGLTDYQRKAWHSPKPRCVKEIHTDDLRVDMQTFKSAFLMLIYGFAASLLMLVLEVLHRKLWQGVSRAVPAHKSCENVMVAITKGGEAAVTGRGWHRQRIRQTTGQKWRRQNRRIINKITDDH